MVSYPFIIDTNSTIPPSASGDPTVEDLRQAIFAIENELGIKPSGAYASTRTRLDILEARINNPLAPAPNTMNPFFIGNTGVSIQTNFGDPNVLNVLAIPGSLYLREDGYNNQGLYSRRLDGYWHQIDTDPWMAAGDLSGTQYTQTVIGLQNRHLSNVAPSDGYALVWSTSLNEWLPGPVDPVGPAGGDLSGNYPNPIVVKIQTTPVSNTTPTAAQSLFFDGTNWKPYNLAGNIFSCPSGVAVNDAVYSTGANSVDKAQANSSSTLPVIGFVLSKPTSTTATVQYSGELNSFSGLTAGSTYYLSSSSAGAITTTAPNTVGFNVQTLGFAKNSTTLVITATRNYVAL